MGSDGVLLEVEGLTKDFSGTTVLEDVSFDVRKGEIHAIIGENGAGKSTAIKIIAGIYERSAGTIILDGQPVEYNSALEARAAGIGVVWQELSLVPYFDAAENIFLGHNYPKKAGLTSQKELRRMAAKVLEPLEADVPLNVPVAALSPALQAIVAIARALAVNARLLVLDEPTSALTDTEIESLFAVLRRLRERGTSMLYISHRLDEILSLTDRVTVLRDGRLVKTVNTAESTMDDLITMMIGRTMDQMYPARKHDIGDKALLEVKDLSGPRAAGVNFTLRKGEVLGIAGLTGSGRSEVLSMLTGAAQPFSGTMVLDGKPYAPKHPAFSWKAGIANVPEERRAQGLIMDWNVGENLTLPVLGDVAARGVFIRSRQEKSLAKRLVQLVGVKTAGIGQTIRLLSGGNQQKVIFGRGFARTLRLLLLDEPTRGIDVGSKHEIYETVRSIAANGTGIIMVSSDLPEMVGLSDRILIMRDGAQSGIIDVHKDLTEDELLSYCYRGVEA